ncbi:MAG: hypothetical protein MI919_29675, partial [Holophagales bacterium]|nr:hypothetical protein [Holophagales bacterium]
LTSNIGELNSIKPDDLSVTTTGNAVLAQINTPATNESNTAFAYATATELSDSNENLSDDEKALIPLLGDNKQVGAVLKEAVRTIVMSENDATDAVASADNAAQAADNAAQIVNPMLSRDVLNNVQQLQKELEKQQTNDVQLLARIRQTGGETNNAAAKAQSAAQNIPTIIADQDLSFSDKSKQVLSRIEDSLSTANTALGATNQLVAAASQTATLALLAAGAAATAAESANVAVEASKEGAKDPLLIINAIDPGLWGNNLLVNLNRPDPNAVEFNLQIQEIQTTGNTSRVANQEQYYNLTLDRSQTNNVFDTLADQSTMATATSQGALLQGAYPNDANNRALENGADGGLADGTQLVAGLDPLDFIAPDIFNLLSLPATANMGDSEARFVIAQASVFCGDRRAFYLVDIPESVDTIQKAIDWTSPIRSADAIHTTTYYPRLTIADPNNNFRPRNVGASGTLAGIYARTDSAIGVWKAPAGVDSVLRGAELAEPMTDDQNGQINVLGINALRNFPVYGNISWGARTLAGADLLQSEYKYINVRRLMNFIEESIFQSLKWAVFQSNNQTLWTKINVQVSTFLAGLFADGAFSGASPKDAFFVQVDGTTTTQVDIDMGIVNVLIGIAPVKPAEFIVLKFQQIAGQTS